MPRILITNDDGVHAEGIRALADALRPLGDITVVAPIQESSAIGHALTLRRPLRIETVGPHVFAIDGTPTDCVNIAITHILKDKPDLIVSGIGVSRAHCEVDLAGGQLRVTDLNSTNGTYIDDKRIEGHATLPKGALLRVGNISFRHDVFSRAEMAQRGDAAAVRPPASGPIARAANS